ncbi:PH domain-containing protein [Blastococcus sp. SYSU DS0617]
MPYPDKLLTEDEEVVRHLHPHWVTVFWPVVRFLLIVGATSFGAAMIPDGRQQGIYRLMLLAVAVLLLLVTVVVPLARWRTTHYVVTTHRLLFREGILARRGRDLGLGRITDVSYTQTLWERLISSGTVTIETAGDGGATVLHRIPDSDGVQQLLNHMIEEDADRRAQESAGYIRDSGYVRDSSDIRDLGYIRDTGEDDWDGDWHGAHDGHGGRPTTVL